MMQSITTKKRSRWIVWGAATALAGLLLVGCLKPHYNTDLVVAPEDPAANPTGITPTSSPQVNAEKNPLDAARAYDYLKAICAIGPRPSGSPGMVRQQQMLTEHFEKLGAKVQRQEFTIRHPQTGQPTPITNLLVQWHPDRKERVLLTTHYDTRPWPDRDPNPRKRTSGTFVGANDGGSGTALLMELAHFMPELKGKYGVDFLLLDAEEFVFRDREGITPGDRYFIGSEYFARDYVANPPPYRYRWGVLVDMIGDRKLQIFQEKNSAWWSDTKPLVDDIWATARRLGVREFVAKRKHEVEDDHLKLRNIGKIPTCDIIDFDYPVGPGGKYWHTEADTPDKCSGESLAKVGWVLLNWLGTAR